MAVIWIALIAAVIVLVAGLLLRLATRLLSRDRHVEDAVIANLRDTTSLDAHTGSVRSLQAADLYLPEAELQEIWSPVHLEALARTYWRFLTRVTLGLIRVRDSEHERSVVLLGPPLRLLTFYAPEFEMDEHRGVVRWRIARGLLVARRGHDGDGYLQIDVRRCEHEDPARARLHVEVEVANFYPAIAAGIGRFFYNETQSRIHVIVTHAFLRSLARLDLAPSRADRSVRIEDVPNPSPASEKQGAPAGR